VARAQTSSLIDARPARNLDTEAQDNAALAVFKVV